MLKIFEEFRDFAVKGNALDMAVGIIIGAAFNKIVNSLVTDIFMPPLGMVIGGVDFKYLQWVLKEPISATDPGIAIRYGLFINNIVEFVIVAWSVFVAVKVVNSLLKAKEKATPSI